MTLKFNSVRAVVEVHVHAKFHQGKCSGSWVINSALDFGQLWTSITNIWNESSNQQGENDVINYDFFPRSVKKNLVNFGPLAKKLTLTFVKVYVYAKLHQAEYSSSWVIVSTSFLGEHNLHTDSLFKFIECKFALLAHCRFNSNACK